MSSSMVARIGDMSPTSRLTAGIDAEGDAFISTGSVTVEFCNAFGGGRSPNTRKAIMDLIEAIKLDNQQTPSLNAFPGAIA